MELGGAHRGMNIHENQCVEETKDECWKKKFNVAYKAYGCLATDVDPNTRT